METIHENDIRARERHPLWAVNLFRPMSYWNLTYYRFNFTRAELLLCRKIGSGSYGDVWNGICEKGNEVKEVIVKLIKQSTCHDFKSETKILETVSGGPSIVRYLFTTRYKNARAAIIFEHFASETLLNNSWELTESQIQHYTRQLLEAIQYIHEKGIIHRDIKPSNIIYNKAREAVQLCDFGNAIFYVYGKPNALHGFSRGYEAPEVLFRDEYYDFAVDMWALGCTIAAIVLKKHRMFIPISTIGLFQSIVTLLGKQKAFEFTRKYGHTIHIKHYDTLSKALHVPLKLHVNDFNRNVASEMAIDFVEKILCFDPRERLLPEQALSHPWLVGVQ